MKKINFIFFIFFSFSLSAQQNLSENEIELINLSLQKSYVLRNADNELRIDSIESKAIKQNFIPTLSLNGMYAYGASKINADIPTFTHSQ